MAGCPCGCSDLCAADPRKAHFIEYTSMVCIRVGRFVVVSNRECEVIPFVEKSALDFRLRIMNALCECARS